MCKVFRKYSGYIKGGCPRAGLDCVTGKEISMSFQLFSDEKYTTGVRGEEKGGRIIIYLNNCKNTLWASRSVIHECTHYKYGIGQSQWAECVCIAQELKHSRNRNNLTYSELRTIVTAVKDVYPEFNWRKGGIINGRRKSR